MSWWVFTPYGAFHEDGDTAKIALNRFQRVHPGWEVAGIFRDDLIIKPPKGAGSPPFLCAFIQGELQPKPQVEEGFKIPAKGKTG
jgi:hypothetical protein